MSQSVGPEEQHRVLSQRAGITPDKSRLSASVSSRASSAAWCTPSLSIHLVAKTTNGTKDIAAIDGQGEWLALGDVAEGEAKCQDRDEHSCGLEHPQDDPQLRSIGNGD